MIDWVLVGLHALWILGLSIMLAVVSFHNWLRQESGRTFSEQMRVPTCMLPLNAGLWLVTLSFVLLPMFRWWERALWGALLVATTERFWRAWRTWRSHSTPAQTEHRSDRPDENPHIERQ
jgi:hypothetical protein